MTPPRIRKLPDALQNHIAAGEVVERPASVLKELMENALDAGASLVEVSLEAGGQGLIQVRDDGHGISPEDLELALTRHATSKLSSLEDLFALRTLGFRGEALASIASVSRLRLASSTGNGEGMVIESDFGTLRPPHPCAMTQGTEVVVRDLFANVPARLKFLRTPATEARKCHEIFQRISLAHCQLTLRLNSGGRSIFHLPPQSLDERLGHFWPAEVASVMRPVDATLGPVRVHGLTGDPAQAQARPDRILLYVNRRPVHDKLLLRAVREAYRGTLLGSEYPQAVVFVDMPPDMVDANVHPAKIEVRFHDEHAIFRAVYAAITQAVRPPSPTISVPELPLDPPAPLPGPKFAQTRLAEHLAETPAPWPTPRAQASSPSPVSVPPPQPPTLPWQYVGHVAGTYLVVMNEEEILLVDQHAAHERVLFHQLRTQPPAAAGLLLPLEFALHPSQVELVEALWPSLASAGFAMEIRPPRLLVYRIPTILSPGQAKGFLQDILSGKERALSQIQISLACHGAVKAGDTLAPSEAEALLAAWWQTPDNRYCPHGRPAAVRWDAASLEKLFKRRT